MSDWQSMSAGDLGRGIGAGQIDPVELTESFAEAIAAHEFTPRIYARMTLDRARAEAEAARERARNGLRRSPLDGVPISWKDLFDTAGVETESGSALLKGRVPDADARVLANATLAGCVCLGKTHQTELAFSGLGLNPITQSPPNVNDHGAVSGGSSSGAATSVAFGLAAAGIGSDTGGSVRIPAGWNDLVGLKTTTGRLSLENVVPLAARFDTVGPLTRTVEDAALLLAAMEGGISADLTGASLKGVRLMVLQTVAMEGLDPAIATAYADALDRLARAGATLIERAAPEVSGVIDLAATIVPAETYGTWMHAIEAAPEAMYPPVLARFRSGKDVLAADFVAAWQALDRLRAAYLAATAEFDAVLLPTVPILPPQQAALLADDEFFSSQNLLALRNTRIGNLLGLCALTLPTGTPSAGVSLMAPPMQEERLLRLGAAAEHALA